MKNNQYLANWIMFKLMNFVFLYSFQNKTLEQFIIFFKIYLFIYEISIHFYFKIIVTKNNLDHHQ